MFLGFMCIYTEKELRRVPPYHTIIWFLYQPIAGAVRATGVASTLARSSGKLCFHFGLYLHHTLMRLGVGR